MYPRRHDLAYFNVNPVWFAGIITFVYGPCVICERNGTEWFGEEHHRSVQILPKGPLFKVLLQANGFTYEAIAMEWDRALGGWVVVDIDPLWDVYEGPDYQLKNALEFTYFQGPPHLAHDVQYVDAASKGVGGVPWGYAALSIEEGKAVTGSAA